jgi:hypothetical protein
MNQSATRSSLPQQNLIGDLHQAGGIGPALDVILQHLMQDRTAQRRIRLWPQGVELAQFQNVSRIDRVGITDQTGNPGYGKLLGAGGKGRRGRGARL